MFRVRCDNHHYDTHSTIIIKEFAITCARTHSLIPCDEVVVTDTEGNQIEWEWRDPKVTPPSVPGLVVRYLVEIEYPKSIAPETIARWVTIGNALKVVSVKLAT